MLTPGTRIGSYEIVSWLGAGGMGEVYRARDTKLHREVALKTLPAELADQPERLARLRQEARILASLNHPAIATLHGLEDGSGVPVLVMELVEGETLAERLRRGPLPQREALAIAHQVAAALEAAHEAGVLHRDLKPANVHLTRDGRVKLLDFGLAKALVGAQIDSGFSTESGAVVGTASYMSPEQAQGKELDRRSDVWAFGCVLFELLSGQKAFGASSASGAVAAVLTREPDWEAVPPETPVAVRRLLERCLQKDRERRLRDVGDAGLELGEHIGIAARPRRSGADERPYPGLSAFTEEDAENFFGREAEVEALWERIRRRKLLALIGSSGAGKTSFLRAGVLQRRPDGWRGIFATPGASPFLALAQALAGELVGDEGAMRELLRFEEAEAALFAFTRWRKRQAEALVVVDQFEELFTLNPASVQRRFADLLGQLASEADVHVVLSLRDDFLIRCHDLEALAPVFGELTPLKAPEGEALRRALVEPAARQGVAFEDEALVDEMLGAVSGERGALPLLAFTVSRLWDERDRERRLLTRPAYERIGGVAGALARHAETTLDQIGTERTPLVRELFRNLVTAQGTRVARERDELLSVFGEPQRGEAGTVLSSLVDARLLTQYERQDASGASKPHLEIVHESLLTQWPRLVRWQTQDADGALLRDQLRQAAQLWNDRGRADDLLWTGTAYRDFALWRERYGGGLSATEQAFAHAAARLDGRRRRRRRIAAAILLATTAVVAITTSALWRRSERSRLEAQGQTRQREAAELLALGRLQLADHPMAALAHAIASLEAADNTPARRFAVEALWRGPAAHFVTDTAVPAQGVAWSPDGRWLALGGVAGLVLFDRDRGTRVPLTSTADAPIGFTNDGTRLLTEPAPRTLHLWSVPDGRLLETWSTPALSVPIHVDRRVFTFRFDKTAPAPDRAWVITERWIDGGPEQTIGRWTPRGLGDWSRDAGGELRNGQPDFDVDPSGERLFSIQAGQLLEQRLHALAAPPRILGRHDGETSIYARPWTGRLVTADARGEMRLWNTTTGRLDRVVRNPGRALSVALDPQGRYLIAAPGGGPLPARFFHLFDLDAPRVAEPTSLFVQGMAFLSDKAFHPGGHWLASAHAGIAILWNLAGRRSMVLQQSLGRAVGFAPDGHLLSRSEEGVLRLSSLDPAASEPVHELWSGKKGSGFVGCAVGPESQCRIAVFRTSEGVILVPLDGSSPRSYALTRGRGEPVPTLPALDPAGQRLAFGYIEYRNPEAGSIRILDLATGAERILRAPTADSACPSTVEAFGAWEAPQWLPDGRLVSEGTTGFRIWDLASGSSRPLRPCRPATEKGDVLAVRSTPDSRVVTLSAFLDSKVSDLSVVDVTTGVSKDITSHGTRVASVALDPTGRILVTGDADGLVRVGPLSGEEPHLLYGHTGSVGVTVSPDGRWIASAGDDGSRLWPMPTGPPLHALPYDVLMPKLRSLTNLRVVRDPAATTGYTLERAPVPSWARAREW